MPSEDAAHAGIRRLTREPLLVFLLLGALIFAVDRMGVGAEADTIAVSEARLGSLRADFAAREGRAPDAGELDTLVADWVTEEALYRRARELGLHRNDPLIRRQLVRKMRYLIEDATPLTEPSQAEAAAWLAKHPERFGTPPRVSFDHVFIARGSNAEARARAALALLRDGASATNGMGDPFPGGARVDDATPQQLARDFGSGFATELGALERHRWSGPVATRLGWHLLRVTERTPFQAATVESAGERLRADYRSHQRERANAEAIETLREGFRVERADRQ
ncbi:peptidyl-prolyl cis-trans isomerase [Algiphilus aromaticivorans]|jgi:hypothetical protein|uniref:peptidylprolyl isomerase n=1 Tax=Algiphilus aromaticivorans TaxID=382454 RepID=UPI0005C141EB|nr:peptidylprolyl isomerase [Algiphilus aromaticivorans]